MANETRTITAVRGVRVGHSEATNGTTGVTAIRFEGPSPTVVDARGGATATYDTASLSLDATFGRRWALFFSGGSVFGLDAARGVREEVLASGGGHRAFSNPHRVAPVSGAALFDLPSTVQPIPDYAKLGRAATRAASRKPVRQGRRGAGAGASIGKYLGREFASPGGVGSAAASLPGRGNVGVLIVLNSVGAIRDPLTGAWWGGARGPDGRIQPPRSTGFFPSARGDVARGTTLVACVTDIPVDRPLLQRIAVLVHDGVARTVVPAHTATDGDVVFAASTATRPRSIRPRYPGELADSVGMLAADLVAEAAKRALAEK